MYLCKSDFFRKRHAFGKFLIGFARESYHDIGGYGAAREHIPELFHKRQIFRAGVAALHSFQHGVASGLQRQVEVRTQFLAGFQALYLIAGESVSFKGAEPDAFNARYLSGSYRVGGCVSDIFPVAAEVYSGEDYLAVSGGRRLLSLAGYFLRAAGAHAPSRSGDYAVGTESVAAVLYFDESAGAVEVGG